jgi:quinol monooxygenase YgiN
MIHVIASVTLKDNARGAFLEQLHRNVPNVLAEPGCRRYQPAADIASGLTAQGDLRDDVVTILESWDSIEALHRHLKTPHMAAYREATRKLVSDVRLQVLQPV